MQRLVPELDDVECNPVSAPVVVLFEARFKILRDDVDPLRTGGCSHYFSPFTSAGLQARRKENVESSRTRNT